MMKKVRYDFVEKDASVNRLVSRSDFAHAETTKSDSKKNPLTPEPDEDALARWILDRRAKGLGGGVRLQSLTDKRNGLYSIDRVEIV